MRRQFPEQQEAWVQSIFDGLDDASIQFLKDRGDLTVLEETDNLPEVKDCIIVVESGLVKLAVTSDDRNLVVGLFGPNDTICSPLFHSWDTPLYFVQAQEQSELRIIPQSAVMEIAASHPALARNVMRQMSWGSWQLMQVIQTLTFYNLPQRVAQVLLNLAVMFGVRTEKGTVKLGLRITQEELAEMAGARRETLSTVLQDFREDDILDIRYARIDIRDMEGLRRIAGTEPLPFLRPREDLLTTPRR
jgi:CRP/FNR family cyclic AMP-dependent transcriptional regulator